MSGVDHIKNFNGMVGYATGKGSPMPTLSVLVWTVIILTGGFSIIFGVYTTWFILLLGFGLLPVTFIMHAFWKVSDPQMRVMEKVQFMKNLALAGAILMLLAIPTPWPLSLFY